MELLHETFVSDDGKLLLCRATLKNTGDSVLAVERIPVYAVMCDLDGAPCHCGKRLKNEKPCSFIHRKEEEFSADPDMLIRLPEHIVLLSWVEMHLHPAMIRMRNDPAFSPDQILSADADFHCQEVMPGAALVTALDKDAVPAGSDSHYGFAEIVRFSADGASFSGRISSHWPYPVKITFAIPEKDGWRVLQKEFTPQADFDSAQLQK